MANLKLSDYYPEFEGWEAVDTSTAQKPQIPDPQTQQSPYLRAPLPLALQLQPDTLKQYNRPGLSTFRTAPIPAENVPGGLLSTIANAINAAGGLPGSNGSGGIGAPGGPGTGSQGPSGPPGSSGNPGTGGGTGPGGTGGTGGAPGAPGAAGSQFDLLIFMAGAISGGIGVANQVVVYFNFTRNSSFAINAPYAQAIAQVGAAASTTFTLFRNGSSWGTINFPAGGSVGTYTQPSSQSYFAGDTFSLIGPPTADVTLANVGFTIPGVVF
jgi:hypothetical protein